MASTRIPRGKLCVKRAKTDVPKNMESGKDLIKSIAAGYKID